MIDDIARTTFREPVSFMKSRFATSLRAIRPFPSRAHVVHFVGEGLDVLSAFGRVTAGAVVAALRPFTMAAVPASALAGGVAAAVSAAVRAAAAVSAAAAVRAAVRASATTVSAATSTPSLDR